MNILDYLNQTLTNQQERRDALIQSLAGEGTLEERQATIEAMKTLDAEIRATEEQIRNLQAQEAKQAQPNTREFNPIAAYATRNVMTASTQENEDPYDTVEYRTAFMNFACRNVPIQLENRESAITMTSDTGAVIPTSILGEIVPKLEKRGGIYSKIRKLNIQGGVAVPIVSLKPKANWLSEGKDSESQKLDANDKVLFNYYGLECKISQTLLVNVTTLKQFQSLFVPLAVEAIVTAIEVGVFTGSGNESMLGILNDTRISAKQKITLSEAEFHDWVAWKKKVFAKMPLAYRTGSFYMGAGTFDGHIDSMTDKNGQPIARSNYGITEGTQYRFGGKAVEEVEEDCIKSYDNASVGDVVAVFVNMNDYAINSNLEMKVNKWTDNDTHEVKNNCLMILDGKLIDTNGVILIKKGSATTSDNGE